MEVQFRDLGVMGYRQAWDIQEDLMKHSISIKTDARLADAGYDPLQLPTQSHFLLVEHPPVYTLGKSGDLAHVLISEQEREARGIEFFHTNRGGDITFHGPGQIVGYPILDLEKLYTDIGRYLRNLEEVIIRVMAYYGLRGNRSPGETGVWLDPDLKGRERKICAMGVRCSRWITMHGFAFNVNTNLDYFNHIVPCGIQHKKVTSLEAELGYKLEINDVKALIIREFENVFQLSLVDIPLQYPVSL
jgi:lipoyl(octanoyl) transferase